MFYKFLLCDENGNEIKNDKGDIKTILIQADDLSEASEIFEEHYSDYFWCDYESFDNI